VIDFGCDGRTSHTRPPSSVCFCHCATYGDLYHRTDAGALRLQDVDRGKVAVDATASFPEAPPISDAKASRMARLRSWLTTGKNVRGKTRLQQGCPRSLASPPSPRFRPGVAQHGDGTQPAPGRSLFGSGADHGVVLGGQVLDALGVRPAGRAEGITAARPGRPLPCLNRTSCTESRRRHTGVADIQVRRRRVGQRFVRGLGWTDKRC